MTTQDHGWSDVPRPYPGGNVAYLKSDEEDAAPLRVEPWPHDRTVVNHRAPRVAENQPAPSGSAPSGSAAGGTVWEHDRRVTSRRRVLAVSPGARPIVDAVAHVQLETGHRLTDVVVRWRYLDTTVQEFADAVCESGFMERRDVGAGLMIDGRYCSGPERLEDCGIIDGVRVSSTLVQRNASPVSSPHLLTVISGPGSGLTVPLHPATGSRLEYTGQTLQARYQSDRYLVSSAVRADTIALSPGHRGVLAGIDVAIDIANPGEAHSLSAAAESGRVRIPYERPPRYLPPDTSDSVSAPSRTPVHSGGATVAALFASAILPALTGIAMYVATRSPLSLILIGAAVLGPFVTSFGTKYAHRVAKRNNEDTFKQDLETFEIRLLHQQSLEVARRERMYPHISQVLGRIARYDGYSTRLWERRYDDMDFLHLVIGYGTARWQPVTGTSSEPEVEDAIRRFSTIEDSPLVIDLVAGSTGICGRRADILGLARSLVTQLVVQHGPGDCEVALIADADKSVEWSSLKWLPQVRRRSGGGLAMTYWTEESSGAAFTAEAVAAYCLASLDAKANGQTGPMLVVVLDAPLSLHLSTGSALRRLTETRHPNLRILQLAPSRDQIVAACRTVVSVDASGHGSSTAHVETVSGTMSCRVTALAQGRSPLDESSYERVARSLARLDDPAQQSVGGGLPNTVRLLRLLGLEGRDYHALAERWASADTTDSLPLRLGVGEDGPVEIDLVRDGPHALVGGTTGSGKSELLSAIIVAAATVAPPSQVRFLLFDFKGGATFAPFERLPHVIKVVSDLDGSIGQRALILLQAEIDYRKRLFAGISSIQEYRRVQRTPAGVDKPDVPRLIVMIDEFGEMKNHVPDYDQQLASIARIGRSLGVHLILSTQSPSEAVKPAVSDNTRIRLALRLQTASESNLLIGVRDAADIPNGLPGRAIGVFGDTRMLFQSPFSTADALDVSSLPPVDVASFSPTTFGGAESAFAESRRDGVKETLIFVQRSVEAAKTVSSQHSGDTHQTWVDDLPLKVVAGELAGLPSLDDASAAAHVVCFDDAEHQARKGGGWARAFGNLLILGDRGAGKTTALVAVLAAQMRLAPPDLLTIYGIEPTGGMMQGLSRDGRGHVASVVDVDDAERVMRLFELLHEELVRRNSADDLSARDRVIILAVDGYLSLFRLASADEILAARLTELFTRGPSLNMYMATTCERIDACVAGSSLRHFPALWDQSQRWILRSGELLPAGGMLGAAEAAAISRLIRSLPPGRIFSIEHALIGQVAGDGLDECRRLIDAAPLRSESISVARVEPVPKELFAEDLPPVRRVRNNWIVPLGIGIVSGEVVTLDLPPKGVVLIAGTRDSGRSTLLRFIVESMAADGNLDALVEVETDVSALVLPSSVKADKDSCWSALEVTKTKNRSRVLIIDGAEALLADTNFGARLATEFDQANDGLILAVTVTFNALNRGRQWWLRTLVADQGRTGVVLRPRINDMTYLDGINFNERSRGNADVSGRGYVINSNVSGRLELVVLPRGHREDKR